MTCNGLARAGFRVVAPRIPAIASARIDPHSIEQIAAVIGALGPRPVGIFSASFSASLCLIAACRAELQPRIAAICAICAIGPYADAHECLRFVMSDPTADPYGRRPAPPWTPPTASSSTGYCTTPQLARSSAAAS